MKYKEMIEILEKYPEHKDLVIKSLESEMKVETYGFLALSLVLVLVIGFLFGVKA